MAYTINKIATLSGVSLRTLRFYDEIGLLKPAYYGDNGYRYYEEAQLFQLQQILFFRELGFSLNDIQKIISDPNFDRIAALEKHRHLLEKNLDQTKQLIETIDKTISHLRGKTTMIKLEDIFNGFTVEKQAIYENFLLDNGVSEDVIKQSKDKVKNWNKDDWIKYKNDADKVHTDLIDAINKNLRSESDEVQKLIHQHYQLTCYFWTPTRNTYIGLSQLYSSHPDFVKFYEGLHPKLLNFLQSAMKIYAERKLM